MPMNTEDPRVRKTRRSLQQAFIRLILSKGFDSISIQDIANEAETARITFYRHYRDKDELLTDCLNKLYEELVQKTTRVSLAGLTSGQSPVRVLYEHIEEQEALYRILFSSRGNQTVLERLRHHMASFALRGILDFGTDKSKMPALPPEIIAYHVASAQLGVAVWWLDQGKPYTASYLAQTSVWLSLTGVLEAIGVEGVRLPPPNAD